MPRENMNNSVSEELLVRLKTIALIVHEGGLEAFAARTLSACNTYEANAKASAVDNNNEKSEVVK